ncbi:uncharacterized protein LOC122958821 [Acropora millepora]|uniref:uncharacterized protein LOC122958821 n=1 Tax=Acropora millepora TaxID=45264 RepID=UPI001CF333F2|nr:uncharacterized protein LOC122958821 [Acropora millepora]
MAILCVLCYLALGGILERASGAGQVIQLALEYDSPLYPTVYHVVDGSVIGLHGIFHDSEETQLQKNDRFTVVLDISSPIYSRRYNWYEFLAIFRFGDAETSCLKSAMNKSRRLRRPYLITPSSVEKPIPFMVPFVNFTNVTLPNGKTVPEYGLVHPDFSSRNFTYYGASYDTSSGVLTGFSASSSRDVGKLANLRFTRKRNKIFPQPLTECYFVEWAPDGCLPGLNILMKGWDMKRLKMSTPPWLRFKKFPVNQDKQYLGSIDIIGYGPKTYLIPKGVSIESIETMSNPFSHVFESVKENVKTVLNSYGIKYIEEATGIFQGSGKYQSYSKMYSASTYSSAISGVEFKAFRVRFRSSFNFKEGTSWDDTFRNEFQALLKSRNKDKAMDFYEEYGTHYIREAEMGGRKESMLSVSYCGFENNEEKKAEFEAKLLIPFYGVHSVSPSSYYRTNLSKSDRNTIISGPFTTCRGGDSLNLEVCFNDSRWRPTVLQKPYPTTLLLEPFYKLTNDLSMQSWLKDRYKEYLLLDLEKSELTQKLQRKAQCKAPPHDSSLGIKYVGSRISVFLAASLVFTWLLHFD